MPDLPYEHIREDNIDTYIFGDGTIISISNDIGAEAM